MTHPMLEKVARAICENSGDPPNKTYLYLEDARAAVRALMDPTPSMVLDGREHHPFCAGDPVGAFDETKAAFRAMLLPLIEGGGQ